MQLGLIGYGNIGTALADLMTQDPVFAAVHLHVLALPGHDTPFPTSHELGAFMAQPHDLVIECAGHVAVRDYIPALLRQGTDCLIASIGALADPEIETSLRSAAQGGGTLILPAGAIGGLDLLASLAPSGIDEVTYEGRKPPAAWRGSPAQDIVALDHLSDAVCFYEGSAREAARDYPKNANVAAALSLAGIGFDRTRVRLVADPAAQGNRHSYRVRAGAADYEMTINGRPSPDMPRTSAATVLSLVREVRNRLSPVRI